MNKHRNIDKQNTSDTDSRRQKRADALRRNLRRRKKQSRKQSEEEIPSSEPDSGRAPEANDKKDED